MTKVSRRLPIIYNGHDVLIQAHNSSTRPRCRPPARCLLGDDPDDALDIPRPCDVHGATMDRQYVAGDTGWWVPRVLCCLGVFLLWNASPLRILPDDDALRDGPGTDEIDHVESETTSEQRTVRSSEGNPSKSTLTPPPFRWLQSPDSEAGSILKSHALKDGATMDHDGRSKRIFIPPEAVT
ncbi:uncharacterized protein EI90DRAFT_3121424 [Cantharellus anzutake]|uniref:uncharacterized protein n=1 Tax=Cantharellus anzutake TaxID=1750568 RepID=UPI001904F761|nr:uncharacterized protein EI90DRAFT_3121424 [Cantharellus anzutake]KAF8334065.1 hypothetical protein EI90DRAFT_3121424 [Cantharellus anzutake]